MHDEGSQKRACRVRGHIIPTGVSAGQNGLMPFVKRTDDQRANRRHEHDPPSTDADGEAQRRTDCTENRHMEELIPGGWNQIDCEGLRAANEDGEGGGKYEQSSVHAAVA